MLESVMTPAFWIALAEIIVVNIILSGDNAVVIALAARSLPPRHQRLAIVWGSAAAIVMRVLLTVFAVQLLRYPYLKLIGSILLLWIGVQLLLPDDGGGDGIESSENLLSAIKTILLADLVMSLDNVIGVAAAAKGNVTLLILGLAISIPLIVFGSALILKLMERFPVVVTLGGALLGFIAGEMATTDPAIAEWIKANMPVVVEAAAIAGAVFVVIAGKLLARRKARAADFPVV